MDILSIFFKRSSFSLSIFDMVETVEQKISPQEVGPKPFKGAFTMDPDNLDSELSKIPLFMTQLPEEENDTLSALQSLVFDGTPEGLQIDVHFILFFVTNNTK